jgi:hypothetical protein
VRQQQKGEEIPEQYSSVEVKHASRERAQARHDKESNVCRVILPFRKLHVLAQRMKMLTRQIVFSFFLDRN